jgi:hypothetical protein
MARYFSREGVEQAVPIINENSEHLKLATNLSGVVMLRALDDPNGKDVLVTYTFDKGRIVDFVYEAEDAPSGLRGRPFRPMVDGLVRVTANYDTFVKLDKGQITVADTVDSPDYNIEGNKLMVLPLMQAFDSWNRVVRTIEKEY